LEFVAGEQENARAGISDSRIGKPYVPLETVRGGGQ